MVVDWQVVFELMEGTGANVMRVIIFVISVFLVLTGLYVFPVLSRFENTIKNTIKNAFLMSLLNLPKSILIVILHFLPVVAVLITVQALPVVFLLGFSTVAYCAACSMCGFSSVSSRKRRTPETAMSWLRCPLSWRNRRKRKDPWRLRRPLQKEMRHRRFRLLRRMRILPLRLRRLTRKIVDMGKLYRT